MLLFVLTACVRPPEPCVGAVQHRYDPDADELLAWPDDAWTAEVEASPTGRRVAVGGRAWTAGLPGVLGMLPTQLDGASGFATLGEIVLRFDGAIEAPPTDLPGSLEDDRLQLWDLGEPAHRVPYQTRLLDGAQQLMVQPLRPLRQGVAHGLVVTDAYQAGGRCITPAALVADALVAGEHDDLLARTGLEAHQVSAVLRFTTHDDQQAVIQAAVQARDGEQAWAGPLTCVVEGAQRRCETAFDPFDFRGASGLVEPASTVRHRVPVTWWLPVGVERPVVVLMGHGLGSDRGSAQGVADRLLPLGVAVVAVDALRHGDHPTSTGGVTSIAFLGIDLGTGQFDGRQMRSNFDQSVLERVQLLSLIRATPDLDADGVPDVDPASFGYVGISLGGLMGAGLLALSDVELAALPIAGGDLAALTRETRVMEPVLPLLATLAGSDAALQRFLSVTQAIVDPADPALWASHVLEDRVYGERIPSVLLPVAQHDEVVPPPSGRALARAFGLPHVGPVLEPVAGLVPQEAPVSANGASGATVGFFQYEQVTVNGVLEPAIHDNLPWSDEGADQWVTFVESWLAGSPTIVDP